MYGLRITTKPAGEQYNFLPVSLLLLSLHFVQSMHVIRTYIYVNSTCCVPARTLNNKAV